MNYQTRSTSLFSLLIAVFCSFMIISGCDRSPDIISPDSQIEARNGKGKKKPPPPPPPPVYFYFDNCTNPTTTGNFIAGEPTNATFLMHYINSPGGTYPPFTSATVNGITLTAPGGPLNVGSGNVLFTASGTPQSSGFYNIIIGLGVGGFINCQLSIPVQNAPLQGGNCSDPGPAEGSLGCVTFIYQGQEVTYQTVRAADGKIWIQQNLGSPYVPFGLFDTQAYGHYFQWGRWDDGHQFPTGPSVTGSSTLQNPSHIPNGNPNFIKGPDASTAWWGTGGTSSDTWSSAPPSSTNGFDPGTALGPGWHIPTEAEWQLLINSEDIFDTNSAWASNLKLTDSGFRYSPDGNYYPGWAGGNYWTSTAASGINARGFFFDEVYNGLITNYGRGHGLNVRLMKN